MLSINQGQLKTPTGKVLLNDIQLNLNPGEAMLISGPNGSGKTSLIKGILDLGMNLSQLRKDFQQFSYLPQIENKDFLLPIELTDISEQGPLLTSHERATKWNLASGGQRKKALIEKTLSQDSQLYVLDEPFNHLDDETIGKVNSLLKERLKKQCSVIIISHQHRTQGLTHHHIVDISPWIS